MVRRDRLAVQNLLSHRDLIPDIEQRLVATEVPCMTFESLCTKPNWTASTS